MSNKTKGTLWSIFMPVVFGLLALVALYNLIYTLRLFGEKGGDLYFYNYPHKKYADLAAWLHCNEITALKTFYLKDGPRYFPGFNFHTLLFALGKSDPLIPSVSLMLFYIYSYLLLQTVYNQLAEYYRFH